jgi:hypothetical protein
MGCIRGGAPTAIGPARHDIFLGGNIGKYSEYFIGKYNKKYNQQRRAL